jgi:ferredoxin
LKPRHYLLSHIGAKCPFFWLSIPKRSPPMPKVTLLPGGQTAEVEPGTLLLDAGEAAGVEMEAGCFNCSCGTCAIEIVSGMENIEPPTDEELNVLDQWNKDPDKYRLTCCVKVLKGDVVMRMEH